MRSLVAQTRTSNCCTSCLDLCEQGPMQQRPSIHCRAIGRRCSKVMAAELLRELQQSRKRATTKLKGNMKCNQAMHDSLEVKQVRLDSFKHSAHAWQVCVCCCERRHDFAIVGFDQTGKCWNRSWDACLGDQREKANHSQTTVLYLAKTFRSLLFF